MPLIFKGQTEPQRFRTWAAVGSAAVGVVGSAVLSNSGSKSNGGAGTQTTDKAPWAAAQPWITNNMQTGQALQQQLAAQPFSPQQSAAYQNAFNQGDYMRSLVPSLLGQMQGQPVGFNQNDPNARPSAWNWDALTGSANGLNQQSVANAAPPPAPTTDPNAGKFAQQGQVSWNPWGGNPDPTAIKSQFTGGYGAFKYGDQPTAGTQAYRDMMEYKNYGGADPLNVYGWNPPPAQTQYSNAGGS